MKIVFLRSNPVNPEPRIEKEIDSLDRNGFSTMVYCWDRSSKHKPRCDYLSINNKNIEITRVGIQSSYGAGFSKNIVPLLKFQIQLFKWLKKYRKEYDAIHACDLDTGLIGMICAKIFHKKLVYDIFDYYVDSYNVPSKLKNIVKKLENHVINNANVTIICSEKRKEQIRDSHPVRLEIIHNSPNEMDMSKLENKKLKSGRVKIVYVGTLQDGRFLKELAEIVMCKKNCELHVGGFGKNEEYFKRISFENNNIFFYGKLDYHETLELESSCDLMTAIYDPNIKNHYYAAPNKFYEALMLGKPVIMIKNTGMSELVEQNKIGKVINYDKQELSKAIDDLVLERENWDKISRRMKKIYQNNFSWKIMEKKLVALYENRT